MANLISTRSAQWPLVADFRFHFDSKMVNSLGNAVDFGKTNLGGAAGIFEIIPLPPYATVLRGEVITEEAFSAASFNVTIGDSVTAARYLASTDIKALGLVPIVPTGREGLGENIRIAITTAGVNTTGVALVRIMYVIAGRSNEVVIV